MALSRFGNADDHFSSLTDEQKRTKLREEIKRKTKEFLDNGGKITHCASGEWADDSRFIKVLEK